MPGPSAYLFDIGNVIITFDFARAARRLAPLSRAGVEEAVERISELGPELETGRLEPGDFIALASERIGFGGSPAAFREAFEDIFELNEAMVDFIRERREEGARLHLLSNTNGIHAPFFERTYPVFGWFHGRIYSHQVGAMKPDPAIYEIAVERLSLDPADTVYIDDLPANCEAGRSFGFRTLEYNPVRHGDFLSGFAALAGRGERPRLA